MQDRSTKANIASQDFQIEPAHFERARQLQLRRQHVQQRKDLLPQILKEDSFVSAEMSIKAYTSAEATSIVPSTEKSKEVDDHTIRTDIKQLLDQADPSEADLRKLQEYVELLQKSVQSRPTPSRYQIIYRLQKSEDIKQENGKHRREQRTLLFFDHPDWVRGQGTEKHIKSNLPLTNFELYLEKNKDISFIVYQTFSELGTDSTESDSTSHRPQPAKETIKLVNKDLIGAIEILLDSQPQYAELAGEFSKSLELPAPYLFIFHSRKSLEEFQDSLLAHAKAQLSSLLNYVTEKYADEYAAADSLLSQNKISPKFLRYLFKPGDLLISRVDGHYQGYVSKSWPTKIRARKVPRSGAAKYHMGTVMPLYGSRGRDTRMVNDKVTVHSCVVDVWHWGFDGNFQRQSLTLDLEIVEDGGSDTDIKGKRNVTAQDDKPGNSKGEKNISDLNLFPIQYASAEIVENCRRRGKIFWKCRTRSYVSYQGTERDSIQNLVSHVVTWSLSKPQANYFVG